MFEIILCGVLVVLYLVFWVWHSPWERKLTEPEIDHYMAIIEKLPLSPDISPRVRRWPRLMMARSSTFSTSFTTSRNCANSRALRTSKEHRRSATSTI
jgi:hypothetical protein